MSALRTEPLPEPVSIIGLVTLAAVEALAATLDYERYPRIGEPLPELWHWLFFWPTTPQSGLGIDGHPRKGAVLPDLGLPRRMWAGGRMRFLAPLEIGKPATRSSQVLDCREKSGRSGRLAFVTIKHQITGEQDIAIEEEQDIVYREAYVPGSPEAEPTAAPENATWRRLIHPTEILLFRYSALTFNSHRIHYDKTYATDVEGYPNLVVHGPLLATLLVDLVRRKLPARAIKEFSFKAVRPTFLGNPFTVSGRLAEDGGSVELWSSDHQGWLTMTALATLA